MNTNGSSKTGNKTMSEALEAYRARNNAGAGFAPDTIGDDQSVSAAVTCAVMGGWELILERRRSDEVAVLTNEDGEWMAIGGDAMGNGAWAVDITAALEAQS